MLRKIMQRNCKQIEPLLWEYGGGRLEAEQMARIDAHLVGCAGCRANLHTAMQIGQGLETLRQTPLPATQTNWFEVRARLVAAPILSQTPMPVSRTGRYRLLMGAGMAAAMALLWVALVPHGSRPLLSLAQKGDNRPAKQGMVYTPSETSLPADMVAMKTPAYFEKSLWLLNGNNTSPYLMRPIAPKVRLASASFTETGSLRSRFGAGRGKSAIHKHRFARSHGFLSAQRKMGLQNAIARNGEGQTLTPIAEATLYRQMPNYVLTDAEVESAPRTPRAYIMDSVSTNAKCRTAEDTSRIGEERAW